MRTRRPIDPAWLRAHAPHYSKTELSRMFGCSRTTIRTILERYGISARPYGVTPPVTREWLEARATVPLREIAAELEVAPSRVSQLFAAFGVAHVRQKSHGRRDERSAAFADCAMCRHKPACDPAAERIACEVELLEFELEWQGLERAS